MKKLLITLLIIFLAPTAHCAQQVEEVYNDLINSDALYFQSAVLPDVDVKVENAENKTKESRFQNHMPFFMKTRLKIKRALKNHALKDDEKQKIREQKWAQKQLEKEKKEVDDLGIKYLEYDDGSSENIDTANKESNEQELKVKKTPEGDIKELEGVVKEQVTATEFQLDCDEVQTDEDTGDVIAIGSPILTYVPQNITVKADKMIYNRNSNILKAIDNVVVTKDGNPIKGDYIQINMNEENMFMDNVEADSVNMKITARKAELEDGKLTLTEGYSNSENSNKYVFISRMVGPNFSNMIINDKDRYEWISGKDSKIRINASEVKIDATDNNDKFQVKDAELFYKDKYIMTFPSLTAYTNKNRDYFEANYPELGSRSRFGSYIGPGVVFGGPHGSTIKLIPLVNYKDDIGFGGAVKFKSSFNDTQIMYGSSQNIWVVDGKQQLDENLSLQYGSNAYIDDWFFGRRMPKYLAELVYDKAKVLPDFLAKNKDLRFRHRGTFGYAHDGEWNMHTEHLTSSGIGTLRMRYMAELDQSLFRRENIDERKVFDFGITMQGSAGVYGTGDTQFVARIGPRIHTQYKYWMQDIGYFATGYSDHTPMPIFDKYRYGHSNVYIREAIRLNRFLSVGWSGSLTLTDDSPNGKMFQENMFVFSIGPDDLKINLGYDILRRMTYFSIAMALDTKNTTIEYDKLEIKNPEKLGKADKSDEALFKSTQDISCEVKSSTPKYKYAEVIEIEDPDKEQI